jgi:hypothetical protein
MWPLPLPPSSSSHVPHVADCDEAHKEAIAVHHHGARGLLRQTSTTPNRGWVGEAARWPTAPPETCLGSHELKGIPQGAVIANHFQWQWLTEAQGLSRQRRIVRG